MRSPWAAGFHAGYGFGFLALGGLSLAMEYVRPFPWWVFPVGALLVGVLKVSASILRMVLGVDSLP